MKENKIIVIAFIAFLILSGIYAIIDQRKRDDALKNNITVIGTIVNMWNMRGPEVLKIQFKYNNKTFIGSVGVTRWDSLAVNDKVRIQVSKQSPDKYIRYIGVAR